MEAPGEQRSKPRKRDWITAFFKDPFGSGAASPDSSQTAFTSTTSGGPETNSQAHPNFPIPRANPFTNNAAPREIRRRRDNLNMPIPTQLPQVSYRQTIVSISSAAMPPFTEHNEETTHLRSNSPFHRDGALQPSHLSPPSWDFAEPNGPALRRSQQSPDHVEHQPPLVGEVYEGVKATLRRIVDELDVYPPLKSTAAVLLVIFDTIDVYGGESRKEFDALLKRVEVLSRIMDSCPPDISQEVKDRFSGLSRALEEKKNILRDKVDATRSSAERVMLAPQEKQTVLKITQEINFAIELAFFDATFEDGAQTLRVVSEVSWLKERITIIEDHSRARRNIESTARSQRPFKRNGSNMLCNSSNFSIGENATFNSIGGDMHIHKNTSVHTSLTEKAVVKDALREVLDERKVERQIYRG